jgi:hypothetical protein
MANNPMYLYKKNLYYLPLYLPNKRMATFALVLVVMSMRVDISVIINKSYSMPRRVASSAHSFFEEDRAQGVGARHSYKERNMSQIKA